MLKKLPEFIQNIVERLFNYSGLDLKYFKQQYNPKVKRKEESRFKGFNLFNKKEIEKTTKHLNNEMDEAAEKFYNTKKGKEKDDALNYKLSSLLIFILVPSNLYILGINIVFSLSRFS